jgi:formate hydrogenlyase subunit 6/NADH:ubiquinone oxidoreductase subunit I
MPDTPAAPKARRFRGQVFIHRDRCKGCGFCIEFCPPKVLAFSEEFNSHGLRQTIDQQLWQTLKDQYAGWGLGGA